MKLRNLAAAAWLLAALVGCSKSGMSGEPGGAEQGATSGTETSPGQYPSPPPMADDGTSAPMDPQAPGVDTAGPGSGSTTSGGSTSPGMGAGTSP